ncbi:Alpha-2-macroglobulin [Trinorchestia longiramus]|nr:Alpha-2-macroglobulin [Trinorchestia longiramus]
MPPKTQQPSSVEVEKSRTATSPKGDSGIYTEDRILPDTITEWVGRAVCVHPDQGVGISASTSITTFTSFFIDLTLPPSIKVGEILPVKISVFNYFNTSLSVLVTLEESSDYEILGANGTEAMADQAAGGQRSACVPTQDKETVVVRIRLLTPGSVNITVSAEVIPGLVDDCESGNPINRRDRIIKSMPVDYEGFMREITSSIYHCSGEVLPAEWPITAPSAANIVNNSIVDNSERGFVTASGDLLGPTLANLGWLIRMPYGCGEQNLARFAPNIYIMHYLERSQQVNATVTEKIIRYMNQGYERQLKYRRTDGSYSSFGNRDKYGSTWLTAFVLKSYAQAKAYISVSTNEIQRTTRWLKGLQVSSGCFESVGHAHNRRMRGSDFAPATLSAYVMAALLEAGTSPTDSSITSAADCITNASSAGASGENDVYLLALKAYAFSLAGLPQTKDVIDDLFTRSDEDINGIYWKLNSYSGWYSGSLSVETTSYVLLAMLKSDYPDSQGRKVQLLKWIISRRNGQGGFISTQDTVVALQALALFGKPVSDKPLNMTIDVSGGGIMTRFQVEESNKLVHQRVDLSFIPDKLNTTASGDGCALLETVVRYNVKDPDLSEVFSLSVWSRSDYSSEICPSYIVNVCATYTPVNKESNMGIIEVNLVSGYRPDIDGLERIVNDVTGTIKRYDVDGSQVIFYIDQFSDSQICVNFPVFQEVEVEFTHPGTVKVYDYYEPDFYVTKRLTFSRRYCKPYWIL